mgnify:CR=1 FL=1
MAAKSNNNFSFCRNPIAGRALFVDRDGILNETVFIDSQMHSPRNWGEIRIYPEARRLRELKSLGFLLILVTNQPDIERDIVSLEFVDAVNGQFRKDFALDGIYCCPFASNDHPDKKPNPGMFLRAAKDFSLTLSECFHLGDTERDVNAAMRCGCKSIIWDRPYNKPLKADHRISTFEELKSVLVSAN